MAVSRHQLWRVTVILCRMGLYLIILGFIAQSSENFFYTHATDRLYYLGMAFISTFAICRALRVIAQQVERSFPHRMSQFSAAMLPLNLRR